MPTQLNATTGYQWAVASGTAAGTTTLASNPCIFGGVYIPATTTGTITFYDSASGTSGKSFSVVNNTGTVSTVIDFGIQMKRGLTYVTGGTTSMIVMWN